MGGVGKVELGVVVATAQRIAETIVADADTPGLE
jgi:hypothetical protein